MNRVREVRFSGLRQGVADAAPSGRVRREPNQPVPLRAGEHLCHRRLLDPGEAGGITLRAGPAIMQRDQHGQMSNAKAKRLESRFAEAGETPRRQTDQMPGRREPLQIHTNPPLPPVEPPKYTIICFLKYRPPNPRTAPKDE